jgi:hypothetical protein
MHFKDFSSEQKEAFKYILLEPFLKEIDYRNSLEAFAVKMLLIANSTGMALAVSVLEVFSKNNLVISASSYILFIYFLGILTSGIMFVLVWLVTVWATQQHHHQIVSFYDNKIDSADLQSYGFNLAGKISYNLLFASSFIAFMAATIWAVSLL